ncbi:unnamed protein product [Dovyalis caffra]|uniref:Ycf15 n=1 Tax=Dovyalis caffra TaxID=77055 RepID=A0AAV1SN06_9ROSI|nr:unnamed protein product [Dovyalis caffra]
MIVRTFLGREQLLVNPNSLAQRPSNGYFERQERQPSVSWFFYKFLVGWSQESIMAPGFHPNSPSSVFFSRKSHRRDD